MRRTLVAAVLVVCATVTVIVPARAANIFDKVDSAPMLSIDPSARFGAMGGASGAVFWGMDPNHWANPALLGLAEGISYQDDDTRLSSGYRLLARREVLGYGGLGVALVGRPFSGLGGLELRPAPWVPLLDFSRDIKSWGIGVSLARLAATWAAFRHGEAPAFTRYADLALGYSHKSYQYAPATADDEGRAVAMDWGLLLRAGAPFGLGVAGGLPMRAEAAYAYSVQNANDVSKPGSLGTVWRPHRHGLAANLGLELPAHWRGRLPAWLAPGFEPLLSLGGAWDREFITMGSGPAVEDASHTGAEFGLANVAFLRFGQRHGSALLAGRTEGYGLALPIGRLASFRYDHARIAWAEGFSDTKVEGWSVWMDPVAIARALR